VQGFLFFLATALPWDHTRKGKKGDRKTIWVSHVLDYLFREKESCFKYTMTERKRRGGGRGIPYDPKHSSKGKELRKKGGKKGGRRRRRKAILGRFSLMPLSLHELARIERKRRGEEEKRREKFFPTLIISVLL